MSKIYLFLPDFKSLVKNTNILPESAGYVHDVFYYEDDTQIYFYKPIGSFVYCFQTLKRIESENTLIEGLTQEVIDELKQLFQAIEVPRMLYVTHIETTTTGVERQ